MGLAYVIGIDLGATKTLAVACDTTGRILVEKKQKTLTSQGKEVVIHDTLNLIEDIQKSSVLKDSILLGIGVGYAGLVNYESGVVRSSIMLPDWSEVPLQSIIERHFDISAKIDNDANAAAYGEWWIGAGAGKETRNLICLTIGTGIGGGLIINNELYRGPDGTAAEFGNMTIAYDGPLCWCGNQGCLNPLASGTAMIQRTIEKIKQGNQSRITDFVHGKLDDITPSIVAKAAIEGDQLACQVLAETAKFLGAGIANLINALNPDMVVLSGGVSEIGEFLIHQIQTEVQKRAFEIPAKRATILKAKLGYKAGAVGAAGILLHSLIGMPSKSFIQTLIDKGFYNLVASDLEETSVIALMAEYLRSINKLGTRIISIVGGEASGKSSLAKNFAHCLENADKISTDDFTLGSREYRRKFFEGRKPLKKYDFNFLREKIELIKKLKTGDSEPVPVYSERDGTAIKILDYDKISGEIISIEKNNYQRRIGKVDYLFVEGDFYPIENPDYTIYFHVPDEVRLQNRISRDPNKRGEPDVHKIIENFNLRQKLQFEPYTLPNVAKSDMLVIVDTIPVKNQLKYIYSIYISAKS